jgi:hypothetical protein
LVLGLVLSAFFWLPALAEKKYILLSQVPIAHREYYFLKLADLWTPKWGYGIPDSPAGFGYQLGWPHLLVLGLAALSMIFALVRKAKRPPADYFRLVFTASSLLLLVFLSFFLFSPSSSIWQALPLFKEINYPWTLLGPMGFVTALLSGFLFRNKYTAFLALALAAAAVIFVLPHARPRDYLLYPDEFYVTNDATTTSSNELMPLWVKQFPSGRPGTTMEITQGEGQIKTVSANSRQIKAVAETTSPAALRLNRIYYPGWDITLDGAPRRYTYDNDYGAMEFSVPPGRYEIKAVFSETPLRQFANLLSLGGLIFCAFFLFLFSPRRARLPRPSKTCPMECDRKT